ncbi:MAG: primosomal protein N' [Bacilli bacterium]|nr:primosomal protein N' [Bacilli bacterium]
MYVNVLVELKAKATNKTFTYHVPLNLEKEMEVGKRVMVPFGNQKLEGFILEILAEYQGEYQTKDILSCTDKEPVLNKELLELGSYISKKTLATQIASYQTMLPPALKAKKEYVVPKKYITYIFLNMSYERAVSLAKTPKQKEIIERLDDREKVEKKELLEISASAVQTLLKKEVLVEKKEEVYRLSAKNVQMKNETVLTEEQANIVQTISEKEGFQPYLLHGVTGSGKTEVYMHLIEKVLEKGKEALVLVPEISLTPQFVEVFENRFGNEIAILHSRLSNGEKYDEWRKITNKEVSIVIGARSAVFAPFENLGIIILDEEHSSSYKQENQPKYHAIDIALHRAKYHKCPIVLGSATPSIESYTRALMGEYTLLELKNRIHNTLPKVELIDMKEEIKNGHSLFSRKLIQSIQTTLEKGEQCILLLNRRGYTTVMTCHDCGYTVKCPHCDIPLTFHKSSGTMRCHYCGYGERPIKECPECQSKRIDSFGLGTQKLEEELQKTFASARIIRMDADTTSKKNAHEKIVGDFKDLKYDILVGTQMIAKGLDFENVTLVGVLNADAGLNMPDFRSGERTFALLNQVAGRAGRSHKKGQVIFQGFNMNHYSIVKASTHDYIGFYKEEMRLRKLLGYPPYYNLAVIEISSKKEDFAIEQSAKIRKFLDKDNRGNTILGPAAAAMPKKNDFYYYKIIIKYKKRETILKKLVYLNEHYAKGKQVYVQIDLNPLTL